MCFHARDGEERPRWPVVEVLDGAIVRLRSANRRDSLTRPGVGLRWTVDSLFACAEHELQDPTRAVTDLELDRIYGFPRRIGSTDARGLTDSWRLLEVRRFTPMR